MIWHAQVIPQFCFLYTELVVQPYLLIPLTDMDTSYLTSQLLAALLPRYLHVPLFNKKTEETWLFAWGYFAHVFW